MGFRETRQLLATGGKFTAVIYTIVEYPSTWKERGKRARNSRRGWLRIAFETRFRKKTRRGVARRQTDGCNSIGLILFETRFRFSEFSPRIAQNFSLNLTWNSSTYYFYFAKIFFWWKLGVCIFVALGFFFFSYIIMKFRRKFSQREVCWYFLIEKKEKIVEIYWKTSPIRNRHDTYKSNYNFTVNYL